MMTGIDLAGRALPLVEVVVAASEESLIYLET